MSITESFSCLCGVSFDEAGVAVRKIKSKEVSFLLYAIYHYYGFAKVCLGMTRGVHQRDEHLLRAQGLLTHVVLYDGIATGKPMLLSQALQNALGRVVLFLGAKLVVGQDRIDDACKFS